LIPYRLEGEKWEGDRYDESTSDFKRKNSMNRKMHIVLILVTIALVLSSVSASAWQGAGPAAPNAVLNSGFTYQGELNDDAGKPINGTCHFLFRLWDGAVIASSNQIGADHEVAAIVTKGRFTVVVNSGNQFGNDAFTKGIVYLGISVKCGSETAYTYLGRERLGATPFAMYAQYVGPHDHLGQVWTNTGVGAGSGLTIDNSSSPTGVGLTVKGGMGGLAVDAQGPIHSSAVTTMYINPQDMVVRNDTTNITLSARSGGAMMIVLPQTTVAKYVMVPVPVYGRLTGSQMYVDSLEVCYQTGNGTIDTTAVVKSNGVVDGESFYILDSTDRGADSYACYTLTATKPRMAVDNTTWIQFNVYNPVPAPVASITIHKIKLNLVEDAN
jgi:hypothetical protein